MNKKGFTLVELLVVIVIIGLISYIGFPSLMALINNTKTTEFEYYGKLMVDAAKVYTRKEKVDWQEADVFKNGQTVEITLDTLINEEYITQFTGTKKDITCRNESGTVQVSYDSTTGTYTFKYKLICEDSSKIYEKTYNGTKFTETNKS